MSQSFSIPAPSGPAQFPPLRPADLVGCRYRRVQQARRSVPPTDVGRQRQLAAQERREAFLARLPRQPGRGDRRRFLRWDASGDEFETLEAMAAEADLITNAAFGTAAWSVDVDVLVRTAEGYIPVVVSLHQVARRAEGAQAPALAVERLGLGGIVSTPYRLRHHTLDGYRLGLAARGLAAAGRDSGWGGTVDQGAWVFLAPTQRYQPALDQALNAPPQHAAARVRECDTCRHWPRCRAELEERDDVTLLIPGDRGKEYRARGLATVSALAQSGRSVDAQLAAAFQRGEAFLRRQAARAIPRAAIEIDVDLEADADRGVYLWGTFDGADYRPFFTADLGEEAANFARFWAWLRERLASGDARAYCYGSTSENRWLRSSARRFAGQPGIPTLAEVDAFVASEQWVDVFEYVAAQLVATHGRGLKQVAATAGFRWREELAGEASIYAFHEGRYAEILRYNADDCRATAWVRRWLADGCPGISPLV